MKAILTKYRKRFAGWEKVDTVEFSEELVYKAIEFFGFKRIADRDGKEVYSRYVAYDEFEEIVIEK